LTEIFKDDPIFQKFMISLLKDTIIHDPDWIDKACLADEELAEVLHILDEIRDLKIRNKTSEMWSYINFVCILLFLPMW
jgi:hypothetical protein